MNYSSRIETAFAPARETFETLWLSLLRQRSGSCHKYFIASAHVGDGATTASACAAIGLARHLSESVLLVEADVKHPGLAFQLGLPEAPGFTELVRGEAPLEEVAYPTGVPGLHCIVGAGPNPEGLGGNRRFQETLTSLESQYRIIIFDGGALLPYSESSLLLQFVEDALLVVGAARTREQDVLKAAQIITASGTPLVGTILNHYRKEVPIWIAPE